MKAKEITAAAAENGGENGIALAKLSKTNARCMKCNAKIS